MNLREQLKPLTAKILKVKKKISRGCEPARRSIAGDRESFEEQPAMTLIGNRASHFIFIGSARQRR
jgi:hypothetical protein